MANTSVVVALVLAAAAFGGNWLWSRQTKKEQIERLNSSVRAPDLLKQHSNVFNKKEIIKVTPNVYCAVGYALANTIMIEGDDGVIIVDVTESVSAGDDVFRDLRAITKKPVRAIIYTHNHIDHTFGAKSFIEDPAHPPDVWAHQLILKEFQRLFHSNEIILTRGMRQFGTLTPAQINSGIGFTLTLDKDKMDFGLVMPNKLFIGSERDISYAGVSMKLVHIPGETNDQIGVWLPDQKVFLCADDVYRAFPNLYAIRGTPSRSLLDWSSSLDKIIDLEPHYLVPSHTRPLEGADSIMSLLTSYRDAIQFVHDQTIRFMNKGLMPDEIAAKVRLPEQLATHPYLLEFYGTVEWSVKGVFNTYLGWFDGDPVHLSPLTPDELANRYVAIGGGIDNMVKMARKALNEGDYRWGLTVSSHVIRADDMNKDARDIASQCMMEIGNQQISSNGRNYFHTYALEVIGAADARPGPLTMARFIRGMPLFTLFKVLGVRFAAEKCGQVNVTVLFEFQNPKSMVSMQLRNSVVIIKDRPPKKYDVRVDIDDAKWRDVLISRLVEKSAVSLTEAKVEGDVEILKALFDCFEGN
ncbi:linear primary-alkylsulfatase-like [Haliotis asinina]|uniref:linear primary-alkylsulfatase-like n=1 Tax=Haliotis asinina TaxID=109174 RepID=UPI0035319192